MVGNVCVVTWYKICYCLSSCKWILHIDGKLSYQITKSQKNVTIQSLRDPSSNRDCVKSDSQIGLVKRDLLEEIPVREDKEMSRRRLDNLWDHDASLSPMKGRGKNGRMDRKHLRLQCNSEKVQQDCWEVPEKSLPPEKEESFLSQEWPCLKYFCHCSIPGLKGLILSMASMRMLWYIQSTAAGPIR